MSNIPAIAVVLEGGVVQTTLVESWPSQLPRPRIIVVDYDTEGAADDELTLFTIGNEVVDAYCYAQTPDVYEAFDTPALSPRAVLAALGESVDPIGESPLQIARRLRRAVRELEGAIQRHQRRPDSHDYNALLALIIAGLAELSIAMGDTGLSKSDVPALLRRRSNPPVSIAD